MATTTPRLGLTKPDSTDLVDIAVLNTNYDILDDQFVTTVTPNYVINGAFDIWQRGTSFSNPNSGTFTADRWSIRRDGTGFTSSVAKFSLGSSELEYTGLTNALIYSVTAAGSGNTYNQLVNRIEDVRTLSGKTVTVSFWAKNVSGSSTITPTIQNLYGTGGSSTVFDNGSAISLTSSWTRYSQTIDVTPTTGKTIGTNSNSGLLFSFSTGVSIQVAITGVQLEEGPVATAFRRNAPSIAGELAACQRYYYRIDTANSTTGYTRPGIGSCSSTQFVVQIPFPATMRVAPYAIDSSGANSWSIFQNNTTYAITGAFTLTLTTPYIGSAAGSATGQTSGQLGILEARNNQTAYIGFSAEL